ncbi:MAG: DUF2254 family protein [Halobacteriota archaeon]
MHRIKGDRSKQFLILFWIIVGPVLAVLWYFHLLFSGSADSARYLLSALAQSQAAIVAIVVTLTLVVVQLTSQTYSLRVMDLFLKKRAFWILLLVYGVSIIYDVILLSMIPLISPQEALNLSFSILNRPFGIEDLVTGGLVLMAITFSALFWFIGTAMNNLKTKNIIGELGEGIDVKSFVEKISERYREDKSGGCPVVHEDDDQVLPLVDITKRAIRADDLSAAQEGISELIEIVCGRDDEKNLGQVGSLEVEGILNKEGYGEKRNEILRHFSCHLEDIGKVASYQEDERTVREVAGALHKLAYKAIENGLGDKSIMRVPLSLYSIGNSSAERRLMDATVGIAKALGGVGVFAADNALYNTVEIAIDSLRWIGVIAVEKNMMWETKRIVDALRDIGEKLVERTRVQERDTKTLNLIENATFIVYELVYRSEMETKRRMWLPVITSAIDCLVNIGYKAEKKRLDIAQKIAGHLKDAWCASVKNDLPIRRELPIRKKDIDETISSWQEETKNEEIKSVLQNILNEMSY